MNNKQITKEAHDAIAEKYYELYKDDTSDLKYFDLFLSGCELKILDLGCADGTLLEILKKHKNIKGLGVEINQDRVL